MLSCYRHRVLQCLQHSNFILNYSLSFVLTICRLHLLLGSSPFHASVHTYCLLLLLLAARSRASEIARQCLHSFAYMDNSVLCVAEYGRGAALRSQMGLFLESILLEWADGGTMLQASTLPAYLTSITKFTITSFTIRTFTIINFTTTKSTATSFGANKSTIPHKKLIL